MVRRLQVSLALVAWVSLATPWIRCHSDCHDELVGAMLGHQCHEDHEAVHAGIEHPGQPCGEGCGAEHERLVLAAAADTSRAPVTDPGAVFCDPSPSLSGEALPPPVTYGKRIRWSPPPGARDLITTVVLLL